ncbi:hypothetical protein Bca4012_025940 [Brassica carinata]
MLNNPNTPALFGRDAPPGLTRLWPTSNTREMTFMWVAYSNQLHFKLAIHAINRKFHFKTTRSSPSILLAQCVGDGCPWRVNYHKLATTVVIGQILQSRFVGIKKGPTAAAIRKILLDEFHVNVSYWKAWRAREMAMEHAMGTMVGSYALIPPYLAFLQSSNVGTVCYLESTDEEEGGTRFQYCFVAYGESVAGYSSMRKVIVVDGTSLKGKYGGCLLSASAQDGNFQIFSLAFAVVNSKNDDAWEWFFQRLQTFVVDTPGLVFISDRHASIATGLRKVYNHAQHVIFVFHLWRNVMAKYKISRLANLMSSAARAFTVTEFNKKFIEIQKISPNCAAYLVDIGFDQWTRVHFRGNRFKVMDSNIAESWNGVLKEAREYPLITMFEYIRTTVMYWFALPRAKSTREQGTITPNVRKLVEENFDLSTAMAVHDIADLEYQVQDPTRECFTVLLGPGTCTCGELHRKIYLVPSVGGLELGSGTRAPLLPPAVRRPPGRPRKVRILSRGEYKEEARQTGNVNVVAVQDTTRHPAAAQYDKL